MIKGKNHLKKTNFHILSFTFHSNYVVTTCNLKAVLNAGISNSVGKIQPNRECEYRYVELKRNAVLMSLKCRSNLWDQESDYCTMWQYTYTNDKVTEFGWRFKNTWSLGKLNMTQGSIFLAILRYLWSNKVCLGWCLPNNCFCISLKLKSFCSSLEARTPH